MHIFHGKLFVLNLSLHSMQRSTQKLAQFNLRSEQILTHLARSFPRHIQRLANIRQELLTITRKTRYRVYTSLSLSLSCSLFACVLFLYFLILIG